MTVAEIYRNADGTGFERNDRIARCVALVCIRDLAEIDNAVGLRVKPRGILECKNSYSRYVIGKRAEIGKRRAGGEA